jgi:hypothetical protein
LYLSFDGHRTEGRIVFVYSGAQGYNFSYTWHEVTERGFMAATPWKLRSVGLNESPLPTHLIREVGVRLLANTI